MKARTRGEQTRAQIIASAEESIARFGYAATSVDDICAAAGVSKGGFYHHFASKQALFVEILENWLSRLDVSLEAVGAETATVPERLLRMGQLGGQMLQRHSGQLRILLEFWEQAAHDPTVWEPATAPFRRYRQSLALLIESGIAEGTLERMDTHIAGLAIVSLGVGLIVQSLLEPQGSNWEQVVEESVRMLVDGVRKRD